MDDEPYEYVKDGKSYCALHHSPLRPYRLSADFLMITYWPEHIAARRESFPCAKWIGCEENPTIDSEYCEECERLQAEWLASNL
jgi:hypothetical protein